MASAKITNNDLIDDADINDCILKAMSRAYYAKLPTMFTMELCGDYTANIASEGFVNIVMQRLKNKKDVETECIELDIDIADLHDYKIVVIDEKEQLVKNISGKDIIIVPWEDSFDIVWAGHQKYCHPSAQKLMSLLKDKYLINCNAFECISEICPVCVGDNQPNVTYSLDYVPITVAPGFNFNHILAYQDTYTKIIRLKPIKKDMTRLQLSRKLLQMFTDFGPPRKLLISHPILKLTFRDFKEFTQVFNYDVIIKIVDTDPSKVNRVRTATNKWMEDKGSKEFGKYISEIERELNKKICVDHVKVANAKVRSNKVKETAIEKAKNKVNATLNKYFSSTKDPMLATKIDDHYDKYIIPPSIQDGNMATGRQNYKLPTFLQGDIMGTGSQNYMLPTFIQDDIMSIGHQNYMLPTSMQDDIMGTGRQNYMLPTSMQDDIMGSGRQNYMLPTSMQDDIMGTGRQNYMVPTSMQDDIMGTGRTNYMVPTSMQDDIMGTGRTNYMLPASMQDDLMGLSGAFLFGENDPLPPEFHQNIFEQVLEDSGLLQYNNQFNNTEIEEEPSRQISDAQSLQSQYPEVYIEDTATVTNAGVSNPGFIPYTIAPLEEEQQPQTQPQTKQPQTKQPHKQAKSKLKSKAKARASDCLFEPKLESFTNGSKYF